VLAPDTPHRVQHAVEEIFTKIRTSFPVCELLLDDLVSLLQLAVKDASAGATETVANKMVETTDYEKRVDPRGGTHVGPVVTGDATVFLPSAPDLPC
jgi:hypothetical protein